MPTTADIARQMRTYGNLPVGDDTGKKSEWEKILAQMAMAQKMTPDTMGGFALGKLLRGAFDDWKANYDKRGELKAKDGGKGGNGGNQSTWQQVLNDTNNYNFNGSYPDMLQAAQPAGNFNEASYSAMQNIINPDTADNTIGGLNWDELRKLLGR